MFLPYGLWQCCHQQTLLCLVVVGTPFQLQGLNKSCPCLHMIEFPAYPRAREREHVTCRAARGGAAINLCTKCHARILKTKRTP